MTRGVDRAGPASAIDEALDAKPVGAGQIRIFVLCALAAMFEGFDQQSIGYTAPLIQQSLDVSKAAMGPVFGIGQVGIVIGSMLIAPVADRLGPRRVLIAGLVWIGLFSMLTGITTSFSELLAYRLCVGIGAGIALPTLVSLASGYAPRRMRGRLATLLWVGVPLGGVVAGLLSSALMVQYGWHVVFFLGGLGSWMIALFVAVFVPEALDWLVKQNGNERAVARAAAVAGLPRPVPSTINASEPIAKSSVRDLLSPGRWAVTVLLWAAFFSAYACMVSVVTWTTSLLAEAGMSLSDAAWVASFYGIGAIGGCIVAGFLIDRFGPIIITSGSLLIGAAMVSSLGFTAHWTALAVVVSTLSGAFIAGAIASFIALAVLTYPIEIRSTGIGWAIGFGRAGGIAAPVMVGGLLSAKLPPAHVFPILAIFVTIAALFIILLGRARQRSDNAVQPATT